MSRARRSLRGTAAVLGVCACAVLVSTTASLAAGGTARPRPVTAAAPAAAVAQPVCPQSTAPPDPQGYAVWVKATISDIVIENGWFENQQKWGSVVTGVSATACGLLHLPSLKVDIQPSGLVFDTSKAKLVSQVGLFVPTDFSLKLAPTGPASNTITGVRSDGTLDLTAGTPLKADIVPGPRNGGSFDCVTTPSATLSTGRSTVVPTFRGPNGPRQGSLPPWTVEGTPLAGTSLIGATATVAGNDFGVPVIGPTNCPSSVLLNIAFGGADETGAVYFLKPGYGPVHHPGSSWTTGTLTITDVDPSAIGRGVPQGSAAAVTPACDPTAPGYPPGFHLGAVGSFSGGRIDVTSGVAVDKIAGTLCGVATVVPPPADHPTATVCTQLRVPAAGQQFQDVGTSISKIPGVVSVVSPVQVAPEDLVAYFCNDTGAPDGVLTLAATLRASAVPQLFGTSCLVGPIEAPVTATLQGPLSHVSAALSSPPFPIDAVQPSATCPAGLASSTNTILGLPLARSAGGLSLGTTNAVYLP